MTHAMQPRHASKWLTNVGDISARALEAGFHEIDASARRVHLLVPQHVCRT